MLPEGQIIVTVCVNVVMKPELKICRGDVMRELLKHLV